MLDGCKEERTGLPAQNDPWMKQRARDPRRDRDEISLADEYFYLASAREFGQIHRASRPDASRGQFIRGHARHVWKQFARMNEKFMHYFRFLRWRRDGHGPAPFAQSFSYPYGIPDLPRRSLGRPGLGKPSRLPC